MRKKAILMLAPGGFGLIVLGFTARCILPVWLLGYGMYEIKDRVEVTSPDGRYIAAGYHIWGGATVSNSTIVTIRPRSDWLIKQKEDSVLIVDMTVPGNNPFDVAWTDKTHLTVSYTPGSTYRQISDWNDLHIAYVPK